MQAIFNFITLKTFSVTTKRKRMFFLILFLVAVIIGVDEYVTTRLEHIPLVPKVIELTLFAFMVYLFTSAIRIFAVSRYRKRTGLEPEKNDNFTIGASTLVGTITTIMTIVWFFAVFEIQFYTFITSIALFSVALATVFKDTIQNFLQGLLLLFSANYRVGDYIEVNNQPRGRIVDITLSKTKLQIANGSYLYVPNNTLNGTSVTNLSDTPHTLIPVSVTVPKETDTKTLKEDIAKRCAERFPNQFNEKRSYLIVTDGSRTSELILECGIAVKDFSFQMERTVRDIVQTHIATLPREKEPAKDTKKGKKTKATS